jgi:hypothetical protein
MNDKYMLVSELMSTAIRNTKQKMRNAIGNINAKLQRGNKTPHQIAQLKNKATTIKNSIQKIGPTTRPQVQ